MDPIDTAAYLIVYRYQYWDPVAKSMVLAPELATLDEIKNGLGIPMRESGEKVRWSDVDAAGIYRPNRISDAQI